VSDENPNDESFEARVRRIAEQIGRSFEHPEELNLDELAQSAGIDVDRAKELFDTAGQWLSNHAENLADEASAWFGGITGATSSRGTERGSGPHPLDLPTAAQGLALSALDSGRWSVEPGSHRLETHGGPEPGDAMGLVGELRARDWIGANGEVTLVGRNALKRWLEQADAAD
jgi:hypothetical protein